MLVTPFLLQSHLFVENAEWIFSIRKQQQQNKNPTTNQPGGHPDPHLTAEGKCNTQAWDRSRQPGGREEQALCQWLGCCPQGWETVAESGGLAFPRAGRRGGTSAPEHPPLLSVCSLKLLVCRHITAKCLGSMLLYLGSEPGDKSH